jgi:cullin-4
MFKDIEISKDIQKSFKETCRAKGKFEEFDFNIFVLTSGIWPTMQKSIVNIPNNMIYCQQAFQEFYLSKHNGRRLTWQNSLGNCVLVGNFKSVKNGNVEHPSVYRVTLPGCSFAGI